MVLNSKVGEKLIEKQPFHAFMQTHNLPNDKTTLYITHPSQNMWKSRFSK